MLTPDYFTPNKWEALLLIYYGLENWIFEDAAKRLKRAGQSGTTELSMQKLRQFGLTAAEVETKIAEIMAISRPELRKILEDSVLYSIAEEKPVLDRLGVNTERPLRNRRVRDILDAEWKKTNGELENLTRTTMGQASRDLVELLNDAEMKVASGLWSYDKACLYVLDQYAGKGVVVQYPSGARRGIEGAVRACIVTSMNQTSAQITNGYIAEGGIGYILTSAHLGARVGREGQPPCADHMGWQGRVFRIGRELEEATGYRIDKQGRGTVIDPLGLHGYNCRHSHKPWDPSLRNPYRNEKGELLDGNGDVITKERNAEVFALNQEQRGLERAIRKTKRKMVMKQAEIDAGIGDPKELKAEYEKMNRRLLEQNRGYNAFCKEHGLVPQYSRNKVSGFAY